MTYEQVKELIAQVSHPDFRYSVFLKQGLTFLQIEPTNGTCNSTGEPMQWRGRKWYLSPHMTRSEIVQTAFLATKTAVEHELREHFTFKGVTVLDPHLDMDNLAQVKSERLPI